MENMEEARQVTVDEFLAWKILKILNKPKSEEEEKL